jgi:hypothetical protein
MRITVGNTLLGDYEEDIPVGGYRGSASREVQRGRGTCGGLSRVKATGSVSTAITVPTKRTFESVSEAEKWMNDTLKVGAYEGLLVFEYADGSETRFPWAVANPSEISYRGVLVTATWQIEAGEVLD